MSVKVSPSILSGDFSRMGEDARRMESAGADMIHCDVMDGLFVPNLTFGPKMIGDLKKCVGIPLDVHLMIVEPERYLDRFIESGADYLSFHVEATEKAADNLGRIRMAGKKAGVAVCPETDLARVVDLLALCDFIVVMGVHPGFSNQKYIPETTERIVSLKREILSRGLSTAIEIDGGANVSNIDMLKNAGADIAVSGSCIFGSPTPEKVIAKFHE